MNTVSEDFERMITAIKPDDEILIPCESDRAYNTQRVRFYRALTRIKSLGIDIHQISYGKKMVEDKIFLRISCKAEGPVIVNKMINGVIVEVELTGGKTVKEIKDEKEFAKWMEDIEDGKRKVVDG